MENKSKDILTNTLLIVTIIFLLWVGYLGFVGGPAQAYKKSDLYYMEAIAQHQNLDSARFINRFALDQVYYVIEAEKDGVFEIAWFDESFETYKTYGQISLETVYPIADDLGIKHERIYFGVFLDELVYVLQDDDYNEIYISIDELSIVTLNGGI